MNLSHDLLIANERHVIATLDRDELEKRYLDLVGTTLSIEAQARETIGTLLAKGLPPLDHLKR